jgi:Uma2 family endonuclease
VIALGEDARVELIGGTIEPKAAPAPEHARVQRSLARHVGGPFDDDDGGGGPGGWWILTEADVRLGDDVVRPDLSGWRRVRLPEPWGRRPIDVVPDWICEIVSPSYEANDRVRKRRLYAGAGVAYYWIVDPTERTLEALRLEGSTWVDAGSFDAEGASRIPPFDAIDIDLARVFPPWPRRPE